MDDPTLSGFSDSTTSGLGNIVGYGGYARGLLHRMGGYDSPLAAALARGYRDKIADQGRSYLQGAGAPLTHMLGGSAAAGPMDIRPPQQQMEDALSRIQGGGYNPGLPPGGWSGGNGMVRPGGYSSDVPLSAPLQALIGAHLRRMLSGQGQALQPPKANFAAMLGQPQQATPAPFGQPAQFGGQGPPGGGAPNLKMNSPGP